MSDKQLLKTIQNDIKNIDYLKSIQQNMEEYELKIGKRLEFKKALKEHNYE